MEKPLQLCWYMGSPLSVVVIVVVITTVVRQSETAIVMKS